MMTYLSEREFEQSSYQLGDNRSHCGETMQLEFAGNVWC